MSGLVFTAGADPRKSQGGVKSESNVSIYMIHTRLHEEEVVHEPQG